MATTPLVSRAGWGARPAGGGSQPIDPDHLTAHYGGSSPWAPGTILAPGAHDRCPSILRAWQSFHLDGQRWRDLAYNSAVCPHGVRFEGRGPGVRSAANGTNAGNSASLATVYIAGAGDPLTDPAKVGFLDEAERFGVPLDRVHSDWFGTSCPGDPLRDWVKAGAPRPGGTVPPPPAPPLPPPDVLEALRKLAPFAQAAREKPVIRRGSTGPAVAEAQAALNRIIGKQAVGVDGVFGPQTEDFVRWLQAVTGIPADGTVGEQTWLQLIVRSWAR